MPLASTSWLRQQASPVRHLLVNGIVAGALQAVLMCAGAWLVAHVLSQAIFHASPLASLWPWLVWLPLIAVARFTLTVKQRRTTFEAGAKVSATVRLKLEERLRTLGPLWAAQQSRGDIVTRFVDGVDALVPYYAGYLPQLAFAAIVPAIIFASALFADPWSALVLAATAPLIPIFMLLVGRAAEQASQRRWKRLRRMGAHFMDALAGLTTLRLFRAVSREEAFLAATGDAYRQETMAVLRIAFLSALVLEFFATASIAVLAVLVGFRLLWGTLGFEPGLFVLLLAPEFFLPLRALGTQRHRKMEAAAAAEDLAALLEEKAPVLANTVHTTKHSITSNQIAVAFRQVTFGYDDGRDVLSDVNLAVTAGERLTIVGTTGSGKSTLFSLLMGFATPRNGSILINGEDLAHLDLDAWRRHIAWVPQRPHIFRGTLRDNLLLASPDADELQLERAIHAAALTPVIARLPRGLDTPLGEHGQGLSGGERQRLSLARAWLRDAPVLLLDEPTQHLDSSTAAQINASLSKLAEGRTVIRIAHRLDAIGADEHVAVMAEGRVVETGRASTLRQAHGAFARLLAADRAA
ncbi:thiol reductant ABC exporter subunit CydD [Dyella caseinilytica]|uniref:Thiol reductant ABC exporter subunit CydD n=1 Tax=Dyella caseinilytica TaxID=1849581 RepID=A0ABX7GR36_9GAMM|nr:thiol reductant ABC exporter subunit CydD [Dyella caseinilytica]QRN52894.1 thiol reductant ABC exporter subunit CydD [Dyella caseinilytica]GGA09650.1 thiol reductant ABC exporter subunit CydD [Dyella caseinilytica]